MGFRSASSFSLDLFVQTPIRSTVLHDVATQILFTEFFIGCIFSDDPLIVMPRPQYKAILAVSHCLHFLTLLRLAPSAVPAFTVTILSALWLHVLYCSHRQVLNSLPRLQASLSVLNCTLHMAYLLQRHLHDPGYVQLFQSRPHSLLLVPSMWEHIMHDQLLLVREVQVLLWREPTILLIQILVQGLVLFPKPRALVLPLVHFGQSKPEGYTGLDTADSDLMHHQFRLSFFTGPARRNRSNIVSAACGKFHAVIHQEAGDQVPHISDQFMAYTGNADLAILLNKDTFEPDPNVLTFKVDSTSKGTWGMILLIVRGLLRRPSLSGSPTVTFCSVHIHNVVAKKRDASTELLQRLHGYMREHNVDFIGGDFNMSAFSTVGDVFTDEEFSAPGRSLLWGLGALDDPNRECAGFLIMPKRPYEWRVHSHGCYNLDNAALGLGPRDQSAHLPVFLHLRTTNLPGPSSVMRSEQAQQRRFERRHNKERMQRRRS